jgi:EmrB/QacA subfamily drug resistance transporter
MNPNDTRYAERRWYGLALLCSAFFMVILDVAVVNVALPSVDADLDFSASGLQWVVSAYALGFGGLLLLGGRAADLLGRRRVFIAGLLAFSAASLLAGLAWSADALVAARALQGLGAALMTPAALSILMTTFAEGAERNKALGIWGAVGASGGTVGLLLGGVLTDTVGWEWIFLLNVPVGLAVAALAPQLVAESRVPGRTRSFDLAGAVSVTLGLTLLVYAIVGAEAAGWGSARTVGLIAAAAALLGVFAAVEARSRNPLLPLRILRMRTLVGANTASLLFSAGTYGMFFVITLYLQQVLGFTPLEAGFAWLALSLTAFASSLAGAQVVTRVGAKPPLVVGLVLTAVGIFLLTGIPVGGEYTADLLPALLVTGLGLGSAFVAISIGALEGVEERDAGLASGIANTTQQIGAALGVAVLSTVALARTESVSADAPTTSQAVAVTEGFQLALQVGAGFVLAAALAAAVLVRGRTRPEKVHSPAEVEQAA